MLPIVALQYLIALRFKNFLVPVGLGFLFWVGALASLSWKFGYIVPYTYPMYNYLKDAEKTRGSDSGREHPSSRGRFFVVITAVSYVIYLTKKEKG